MSFSFSYVPKAPLLIIVGNFGSGKTEVAVHLALHLAASDPVKIVDLDIVNPYFRCREAREEMESKGIEVIYPKGEFHAADLPIILPQVRGSLFSPKGFVIFDVGGDDVGARALSSLAEQIADRKYSMLQVVNAKRPFTSDVEGCVRIRREIEAASRLKVTGLISNAHLMDETDEATIRDGLDLARAAGAASDLPVEFATADPVRAGALRPEDLACPLLPIRRRMLPPWRLKRMTDRAGRILKDDGKP